MYAEEFAVFLGNKGITTVRAGKPERCGNNIAGREGLTADFALVLPVTAIVVVDVMVGRTAEWTDDIFGNGFTITTLNGFKGLAVLPLIVSKKGTASPV